MTREERAYNYAANKKATKFTVCEIAKHYNDGYSDGYKDAVDKACEWLKCNFNMPDDFESHFRKAMEENK